MSKRLISFFVALVMVLGMVPVMTFAAETENVIVAVNGVATVNGTLDEERWALTGHLGDDLRFGAMYNAGYLYLGVDAAIDSITVKLNGADAPLQLQKSETATEAVISLADAGLELTKFDQVVPFEITAGGNTWEGSIRFSSSWWLHMTGGTVAQTTDSAYSGGSNTDGVLNFYSIRAASPRRPLSVPMRPSAALPRR